ncbi:gag/pol protein [Cucumis melo var. makuwa]|uniref:Gag/pol protein n=1 Tax=Cucumis melo var. makuwa TaxID=1194695 RepID=A0A5A7T0X7_CUCMM|nr:gag/pol protein [Cucumis melo var. makuwa]TYK22392.1 gag/pol protein [Cucumis melo var. makuwa]
MKSYCFEQNVDEPYVYKKVVNSIITFLVLYVDDILLIGNDVGYLIDIKKWLHYKKSGFFQHKKTSGEVKYMSGKDLPTQSSVSGQTSGEVSRDRLFQRCVGHASEKPLPTPSFSTQSTTSGKPPPTDFTVQLC